MQTQESFANADIGARIAEISISLRIVSHHGCLYHPVERFGMIRMFGERVSAFTAGREIKS
jgi:hypothetical protein